MEPTATATPTAEPAADTPQEGAPLDLSHLEPPRDLEQVRLEEVTIDGICGVY